MALATVPHGISSCNVIQADQAAVLVVLAPAPLLLIMSCFLGIHERTLALAFACKTFKVLQ